MSGSEICQACRNSIPAQRVVWVEDCTGEPQPFCAGCARQETDQREATTQRKGK